MDNTTLILQQQAQILDRLSTIERQLSSLAGGNQLGSAADAIALGATDPLELIKQQNARRLKARGIKTSKGRRVR